MLSLDMPRDKDYVNRFIKVWFIIVASFIIIANYSTLYPQWIHQLKKPMVIRVNILYNSFNILVFTYNSSQSVPIIRIIDKILAQRRQIIFPMLKTVAMEISILRIFQRRGSRKKTKTGKKKTWLCQNRNKRNYLFLHLFLLISRKFYIK